MYSLKVIEEAKLYCTSENRNHIALIFTYVSRDLQGSKLSLLFAPRCARESYVRDHLFIPSSIAPYFKVQDPTSVKNHHQFKRKMECFLNIPYLSRVRSR